MNRVTPKRSWIAAAATALALMAPGVVAPTAIAEPVPTRAPVDGPAAPATPFSKVQLRNVNGLWIPPGLDMRKRADAHRGFSIFYPKAAGTPNRFIRRSIIKATLAGRGVGAGNLTDSDWALDGVNRAQLAGTKRAVCVSCASRRVRCTGIQHFADSLTTVTNHGR